MPNQGIKILTGTTVTLLLSAVAVGPAMAGPSAEIAQQRQQVPQMNGTRTIRGSIKSIVGEVIKVQEANGNVIELRLSKRDQGILGLVSGMDIVAQVASGRVLNIAMATAASSQTASSSRSTSTSSGSSSSTSSGRSTSSGSSTNSTTTITRPAVAPAPSPATITRPVLPPPVPSAPVVRPVAPPPMAPAVRPVVPAPAMTPSVTVPRATPAPVRALW